MSIATTAPSQILLFGARTRPSRPLLAHVRGPGLLRRVQRCLALFPELDGQEIRVGITRAADGIAVLEDMIVRFDVRRRLPTYYTVGHELTHLLQALGRVPHGEIQCDIWTLARDELLRDEAPCYLPLPEILRERWPAPADEVAALCVRAIGRRPRHRTYIRWLRDRLGELAAQAEQEPNTCTL